MNFLSLSFAFFANGSDDESSLNDDMSYYALCRYSNNSIKAPSATIALSTTVVWFISF